MDAPTSRPAGPPSVGIAGHTTLDPRALYFVSYDGLVNTASYQQDGILTHGGHQYAAWYTADRHALVARRDVTGTGRPWEVVALPHRLSADDSHNTISLGVSAKDGRLHVAMDTHGNRVFYLRSVPHLAGGAGGPAWTAAAFGEVERSLCGVDLGDITYPRFLNTPRGDLQLGYRTGHSGNGWCELAEYAGGTWRRLGRWSSAEGRHTTAFGVSDTRNMYLHGIGYDTRGRLHATFTWREDARGGAVLCHPGGCSNHDTGYVHSDDEGRTWRTGDGAVAAVTGTDLLVSLDTPGHVVDPLGVDHALMNQEAQAVDSQGRPHVLISHVPLRFTRCVSDFAAQRRTHGRVFHLSLRADGRWRKRELPEPLDDHGRSRLVLDRNDDAYVIMPRGRIVTASAASGWTDWRTRHDGAGLNVFGEVLVDASRVRTHDLMSIMYQEASEGTRPSALRVLDVRTAASPA
ncbi:BNR repeat-containing protein [Streptosporangium sp. NPDC050855]|uniref:BNR repeat-containing protein n=1 Tax=Streptosporangium sp. NPDC050855 TaxID=3366194 RepID=UPI003787DE2F